LAGDSISSLAGDSSWSTSDDGRRATAGEGTITSTSTAGVVIRDEPGVDSGGSVEVSRDEI
jgi:hypothetical protein